MGHLRHGTTRSQETPAEWLGVGRAIGLLVNEWALRDDLVAFVGKGAGHGSPACYNPDLAEVEVDVARAFGVTVTPEQIGDLTERSRQYEFPKAVGTILHEAFHARYSQYDLKEATKWLTPSEHKGLMLLEESRIEAFGVRTMPRAIPFLRSSAMEIVIDDAKEQFPDNSNVENAALIVALVHGRIEAGVLSESEAGDLITMVNDFLGLETVARLVSVIRRAQAHDQHANPLPLYDLAREWAKILQETAEEKGEQQENGEGDAGGAEGAFSEFVEALKEMMSEAAQDIEIANNEALAEQEQDEDWQEEVKAKEKIAKEHKETRSVAREVFGAGTAVAMANTHSTLKEERKPTAPERVAAVTVAQMLEKAKYRERDVVEIASASPAGRLRTRALVQGVALKSRGIRAEVEPWRKKVRKQTDDPTLTVGVMVDISGSMRAAMEPMATTAWVMSEAARRVQGRVAMVYYGNDVFPTLKAGQHLDTVQVYTAHDGTEKFDKAFRALDGSLDLLHGSGARLLVIVSDGYYTHTETEKAREWLQQCAREGVAVLWLPFDGGESATRLAGKNATVLSGTLNPTEAADAIGRAAAEALTRIGARA
jgi:hypothetical protein